MFRVTDAWRAAFPGAAAGMLLMRGVANPPLSPALREHAGQVERELRERFGAGEAEAGTLAEVPVLQAYRHYYKAFGQNCHVQLQLGVGAQGQAGIGAAAVRAHLDDIAANVQLMAPEATVETVEVWEHRRACVCGQSGCSWVALEPYSDLGSSSNCGLLTGGR